MDRPFLRRLYAIAPIVMSLLALIIVLATVATEWERNLKDEGAGAHLFQLLIVSQAPLIMMNLRTANWRLTLRVRNLLAVQLGTLATAIASVGVFKL